MKKPNGKIIEDLNEKYKDCKCIENIFFEKIDKKMYIVFKVEDKSLSDCFELIPDNYEGFDTLITHRLKPIFEEE